MEATRTVETLMTFFKTVPRDMPEDSDFQSYMLLSNVHNFLSIDNNGLTPCNKMLF
jgi:hypothetical protein